MRTLILGIGNLLLGDEGVGCRCVAALESRYSLPPEVVCEDGGTSGFELLPLIENANTLIVAYLDLVDALAVEHREHGYSQTAIRAVSHFGNLLYLFMDANSLI